MFINNTFILRSNTKLRRIGYLKLIIKMINEHKMIPINRISMLFEQFCDDYKTQLNSYKDNKGIVNITKTGSSAKPYIELATELDLIQKCNGESFSIGKKGVAYNLLNQQFQQISTKNEFELSKWEIAFFLESIIRNDYLYISPLVTFLNQKQSFNLVKDSDEYKCFLYDYLKRNSNYFNIDRVSKIKDWNPNNTYLEHIIMPRINWLYDFEIVEVDKNNKYLPTNNLFCLNNLLTLCREKFGLNPEEGVISDYMHFIDKLYKFGKVEFQTQSIDLIKECFEYCFMNMKTIIQNRINYSSSVCFVKFYLYFHYGLVFEEKDIRLLLEKRSLSYALLFQRQFNDGFILKHA